MIQTRKDACHQTFYKVLYNIDRLLEVKASSTFHVTQDRGAAIPVGCAAFLLMSLADSIRIRFWEHGGQDCGQYCVIIHRIGILVT